MDSSRDDTKLAAALEELRPEPRPEFTAELDERAAAGFPRRSRLGRLSPRAAFAWLRALPPRKVLLPVGAAGALAALVAVVLVADTEGGNDPVSQIATEQPAVSQDARTDDSRAEPESSAGGSGSSAGGGAEATGGNSAGSPEGSSSAPGEPQAAYDTDVPAGEPGRSSPTTGAAADAPKRSIERSARMTIGTEADRVSDAAAQAFQVVHANDGIVLRSSVSDGGEERPGASFELLIPAGKLGDALAAFSEIGEVLSRNEATADITAPTVGATERLRDSRARIDSLLGQLAEAGSESERQAVEAELRTERRRAARLRQRVAALKRRANLSRVSLRVEATDGSSRGGWGIGDAFDDAGRLLAGAAAVAIVALAVLAPISLLALLAWLAHRAWLRRARARTLG